MEFFSRPFTRLTQKIGPGDPQAKRRELQLHEPPEGDNNVASAAASTEGKE